MNYNLLIFGEQLRFTINRRKYKTKRLHNKIYVYTNNDENCCKYVGYDYIEIIVNSYNNS